MCRYCCGGGGESGRGLGGACGVAGGTGGGAGGRGLAGCCFPLDMFTPSVHQGPDCSVRVASWVAVRSVRRVASRVGFASPRALTAAVLGIDQDPLTSELLQGR